MLNVFNYAIHPTLQVHLGPPDSVTSKWIFLNSPLPIIVVLSLYFLMVFLLKKYMRDHKPFELRFLLVLYNILQVLLSAYICKEVTMSAISGGYSFACTSVNSLSENGVRMASVFWLFYLSKMFDLCDTIFFVVRKKHNQITFLHMYHHSSMVFNWYLGCLYSPGGQAFFSVMLNSFVHVIMYTYYMLAAIGPRAKKYVWWKRYLTQLQLAQFFAVNVHLVIGLYNKCKAPFWLNCFTISYVSTLVILFANFYYQSYKNIVTKQLRPVKEQPYILEDIPEEYDGLIDYQAGGDFIHRKTL